MAEVEGEEEYYYEEEEVYEEDHHDGPWFLMPHYAHMSSTQYYAGFGAPFIMMFGFMLGMLIWLGHWTVSAAYHFLKKPLIIVQQFNNPRTIPGSICFIIMFLCSIGAWSGSFLGFMLNYFELPPCKTYVFLANLCNLCMVILILFCISYMCLIFLQYETLQYAFTYYYWNIWKSRQELSNLPNGMICSRSGPPENTEAERMECFNRTYDYLKTSTFVLAGIGIGLALLSMLAIWHPIAGGGGAKKDTTDYGDAEEEEAKKDA